MIFYLALQLVILEGLFPGFQYELYGTGSDNVTYRTLFRMPENYDDIIGEMFIITKLPMYPIFTFLLLLVYTFQLI